MRGGEVEPTMLPMHMRWRWDAVVGRQPSPCGWACMLRYGWQIFRLGLAIARPRRQAPSWYQCQGRRRARGAFQHV